MRRATGVLGMGILLIAATPTAFGGWAVVTLEDVPEYLEVGKPTTLSFMIRQHGRTILYDRSPTVTVRQANGGFLSGLIKRRRVAAVQGPRAGVYQATITPSDPGEVSVTIDTDLFRWKVELLPFRVVAADDPPPPLSPHGRGLQLFAAKGCATCHAKQTPELVGWQLIQVGPDLTNRSYPADWLAQKLADPARYRAATTYDIAMPNLALDKAEIDALVAFINRDQVTTEDAQGS